MTNPTLRHITIIEHPYLSEPMATLRIRRNGKLFYEADMRIVDARRMWNEFKELGYTADQF